MLPYLSTVRRFTSAGLVAVVLLVGFAITKHTTGSTSHIQKASLLPTFTEALSTDAGLRVFEVTIASAVAPIRWTSQKGKHFGANVSLAQGSHIAVWPSSVEYHPTTNQAVRIRPGSVFFVVSGSDTSPAGTPMITETAMPITTIE
jgi:hypothetical protein